MDTTAPGWILMTMEIRKRFSLEDLCLNDHDLVAKYHQVEPNYNVSFKREKGSFKWLIPFALRLCITKNLAHERC